MPPEPPPDLLFYAPPFDPPPPPKQRRSLWDIERTIKSLAPDLRYGLLHGRMPAARRQEVMDQFRRGELDILAATTIIEVGVDVPGANLMLVDGADFLGLSQLHQLRGRIGRGGGQGLFAAISSPAAGPAAEARIKTLADHSDGYELAEMDLKLRGPGEELGLKQSGWPNFRFVRLPGDLVYLPRALELAADLWARLDQWPDLAERIARLAKELAVLPPELDPSAAV
jgi:ATP-dependent DNA helicase RecG